MLYKMFLVVIKYLKNNKTIKFEIEYVKNHNFWAE